MIVPLPQTIAGFYKAFGQTFILDDHFLSFVGAVCSVIMRQAMKQMER